MSLPQALQRTCVSLWIHTFAQIRVYVYAIKIFIVKDSITCVYLYNSYTSVCLCAQLCSLFSFLEPVYTPSVYLRVPSSLCVCVPKCARMVCGAASVGSSFGLVCAVVCFRLCDAFAVCFELEVIPFLCESDLLFCWCLLRACTSFKSWYIVYCWYRISHSFKSMWS